MDCPANLEGGWLDRQSDIDDDNPQPAGAENWLSLQILSLAGAPLWSLLLLE